MANKNSKKKYKITDPDRYNLGSFVVKNQQGLTNAGMLLGGLAGDNAAGDFLTGASSGFATGASIGSIVPGVGTAIGGAVGGIIGGIGSIFGGGKRRKAEERARQQRSIAENRANIAMMDSTIDRVNENPMGVFADGGDVPFTEINVEKGELQIDPETGKILREYKGINPETGGKYEPHAKGNKKDSPNNIVSAEEGTFIITKKKATDYKNAVENNDKLAQNAIMQNIRNKKKRNSYKFANGGRVSPLLGDLFSPGVEYNSPVTNLTIPSIATNPINGRVSNNPSGINFNSALDSLINYGPSLVNLFQSRQTPNYLSPTQAIINPMQGRIMQELPREINFAPIRNDILRQAELANDVINQTTSSSAIARANKNNVLANTQRNLGRAYMDSELSNNQVRGQRASILNNLGQQNVQSQVDARNYNLGIDTTNRQMDLAKQQQLNYSLSQAQQMYQANRFNNQRQNMDARTIELLKSLFPSAGNIYDNWLGGTNG